MVFKEELDTLKSGKKKQYLLHEISNHYTLKEAYLKIKSDIRNRKNKSLDKDSENLDKIQSNWFTQVQREIRSGVYKPKPKQLIYTQINNQVKRHLAIPTLKDKIIQEAMRKTLSNLFEPTFLEASHAFRPGRNSHTALNHIRLEFQNITWILKGDISKSFDLLNHHSIYNILMEKIDDKAFSDFYWKMARVGYFQLGGILRSQNEFSQGSIVSPLLCNIYLHKLDSWVNNSKHLIVKQFTQKHNNMWNKNTFPEQIIKQTPFSPSQTFPNTLYSEINSIKYVRYAHDFLIGVIGSRTDAELILRKIYTFLNDQLNLDLNYTKIKIINPSIKDILFLETHIRTISIDKLKLNAIKNNKSSTQLSSLQLKIPIQRILDKLIDLKFIDKKKQTPTRVGKLISLSEEKIVNHFYNVYKGFANYYSFCENHSILSKFHYILKTSCALTLCSKMKLQTKRKTFLKYGKNLTIKKKGKIVTCFPPYRNEKRSNIYKNF